MASAHASCVYRSEWHRAVAIPNRNKAMADLSNVLTMGISGACAKWRKEGKVALVIINAGKSDFSTPAQASKVLDSWGSAIFDLGFPCSDNLAGSSIIQAAASQFLGRGIRFVAIKSMLKEVVRQSFSAIALFLHYDQILKLAIEKFNYIVRIHGRRPPRIYDVVISYKRDDTLHPVSHLKGALDRREIRTFIDYTMDGGEEIRPAIEEVIERSNIAVVVVSQNFHSSPWCLNELVKILECHKKRGLIVLPIFWGIDARELREQSSLSVENIGQGEERFKQEKPHLVRRWKKALRALGMINGWSVSTSSDKTEAEVIENLADKIVAKLNHSV